MKVLQKYYLIIVLILFANVEVHSQNAIQDSLTIDSVFAKIHGLLKTASFSELNDFFVDDSYISLKDGPSGYYSKNQSYYLLNDYFKFRRITKFNYKSTSNKNNKPYIIAEIEYLYKREKITSKLFIALKKYGANWMIYQFTIN